MTDKKRRGGLRRWVEKYVEAIYLDFPCLANKDRHTIDTDGVFRDDGLCKVTHSNSDNDR